MTSEKKIYHDMTRVTLLLIEINTIVEEALNGNLTQPVFADHEKAVRELAGMDSPHPALKSVILPFAEAFLREMNAWMKGAKNQENLFLYANILNGSKQFAAEIRFSDLKETNSKFSPAWYEQTLQMGKQLLEEDAPAKEKLRERAGSLFRNIPADTTLGYLSLDFFRRTFLANGNREDIERLWSYLNGTEPLHAKVKIQGTFAWLEY